MPGTDKAAPPPTCYFRSPAPRRLYCLTFYLPFMSLNAAVTAAAKLGFNYFRPGCASAKVEQTSRRLKSWCRDAAEGNWWQYIKQTADNTQGMCDYMYCTYIQIYILLVPLTPPLLNIIIVWSESSREFIYMKLGKFSNSSEPLLCLGGSHIRVCCTFRTGAGVVEKFTQGTNHEHFFLSEQDLM